MKLLLDYYYLLSHSHINARYVSGLWLELLVHTNNIKCAVFVYSYH